MRRMLVLATVVVLVVTACSGSDDTAGERSTSTSAPDSSSPASGLQLIAALEPFDSCDALLEDVTDAASERVGPYGLESPSATSLPTTGGVDDAVGAEEADGAGDQSAAPATPPSSVPRSEGEADPTYSDTNVQEVGVDEPDLVKTDGSRVLVVADGTLHVLTATGDAPQAQGELALPDVTVTELFLRGDRALLLGTAYDVALDDLDGAQPDSDQGNSGQTDSDQGIAAEVAAPAVTVLVDVDLTDPAVPRMVSTQYVEGNYLSARAVDGTARIVVSSSPQPVLPEPPAGDVDYADDDDVERWEDAATAANRQAIERSNLEDWLPQVVTVAADGTSTTTDRLANCEQVSHPREFSGFGMLSVLTTDLDEPLGDLQAVSVMADGETVYAGTDGLYIATNRWETGEYDDVDDAIPSDEYSTEVHRFGITEEGPATYEASGSVRGHLLDQFSLSEYDGHLRVATTDGAPWGGAVESESYVTVLRQDGEELRQVGQVGDMGQGEQIFAVRFQGDVGYVVTFEQTDPLYTVDLSDPTAPTVLGELKILGYSAYLHPAGDGQLIGVGQDATEEGALLGTQVSLFDVSDLADPQRIQQASVGGASSSGVEYDHRAFLWWPTTSTAVIPVEDYETGFAGVIVYRISPEGISELGRISHAYGPTQQQQQDQQQPDQQQPAPPTTSCPPEADCVEPLPSPVPLPTGEPILRSLVIGDQLWTVSARGVQVNDLSTLADEGFVAF